MSEFNIEDLLKLYEEGKATEQQRQLVEAYLAWHQQQSPKREPNEENSEQPLQEIMEKIRLAREQETGSGQEAPIYPMEETGRRRRTAWIAAASIAVIIAGALLWRQSIHQPGPGLVATTYKTIQAAPGKTIHLRLSDSSEVWLNAGAVLRYPQPFDDKMRKLELLDGEAFFQVHPDAGRGFVVKTDHLQTQVLGTAFNIKAYRESQQMSVTVKSGKVSVSAGTAGPDGGMILTADQQARYNTGTGQLSRGSVVSGVRPDWKSGEFDFAEEDLGDIAIELEHYFNVHIGFKYPGLKKYIISASFRQGTSLKDMLTTLCLLNQNHFTQTDAQHYVIH